MDVAKVQHAGDDRVGTGVAELGRLGRAIGVTDRGHTN
jgi:hypothetical protein